MININELRIGNFVSTNGKPMNTSHKDIYKVLAIDSRDSFEELKGCVTITCDDPRYRDVGAWCKYLEPIPLTPELLGKCGFVFDDKLRMLRYGEVGISMINKGALLYHIKYEHKYPILISIKYLHQLQNTYYILTGEELEVKL